jgi:hypothetical protein
MERLMRMLKGLTACVVLVGAFALTTPTTHANTRVSLRIAVDNEFTVFAINPTTNQLLPIGGGSNFAQAYQFDFSAPPGSYIYVLAKDLGVAGLMVTKVVFDGGAETVLSGVPGTWPDWEVNTVYRDTRVNINNPITVLNWGGEWEAPAVGDPASTIAGDYPDYGTFDTARFIWAQPGGAPNRLGFTGYTGEGTALFRLQVYPEPASMLALGAGLAGLAALRRRKR